MSAGAWIWGAVVLAALVVTAWRESQAEKARQTARMYAGRRDVEAQIAAARLDYFARTAPPSEIAAAVRLHESIELDRAAARVVAEMAAQAADEARRAHPAGWFDADTEGAA